MFAGCNRYVHAHRHRIEFGANRARGTTSWRSSAHAPQMSRGAQISTVRVTIRTPKRKWWADRHATVESAHLTRTSNSKRPFIASRFCTCYHCQARLDQVVRISRTLEANRCLGCLRNGRMVSVVRHGPHGKIPHGTWRQIWRAEIWTHTILKSHFLEQIQQP